MLTYPIIGRQADRPYAFEIENADIGPRGIARLLTTIAGVSRVRRRKPFLGPKEVHIEFVYRGQPYIVWEPYGDSSRYWIGPNESVKGREDISDVEDAFRRYRPSLIRRILGALLSLDWVSKAS